jgi:hypothetical protein
MLLIMHQWRAGHFSEDQIPVITRCASSTVLAPVKQLLSTDQAGLYFSKRCDAEKDSWAEKKATYKERAAKGGKAKAEKSASSSASSTSEVASSTPQAVLETCSSPSPSPSVVFKFSLPTWIPKNTWKDYEDMRKRKRAGMTDSIRIRIVERLGEYRARGHDPVAILGNSIRNSWTDVFEPTGGGNGKRNAKPSIGEIAADESQNDPAGDGDTQGPKNGRGFFEFVRQSTGPRTV